MDFTLERVGFNPKYLVNLKMTLRMMNRQLKNNVSNFRDRKKKIDFPKKVVIAVSNDHIQEI